MAQELIEVELIANPEIYRTITKANYELSKNKWRQRGQAPIPQEIKKKVVSLVEDNFVTFAGLEEEKKEIPTSVLEPVNEPDGLLAGLRSQYEAQSGKKVDGRWNLARLTKEIKELTPQA